jgi:hypothetical protein
MEIRTRPKAVIIIHMLALKNKIITIMMNNNLIALLKIAILQEISNLIAII